MGLGLSLVINGLFVARHINEVHEEQIESNVLEGGPVMYHALLCRRGLYYVQQGCRAVRMYLVHSRLIDHRFGVARSIIAMGQHRILV